MLNCCSKAQKEYCFLQYVEILSDRKLRTDAINTHLGCIQLQWCSTFGVEDNLSSACVFGRVPLVAIRETVLTLSGNQSIHIMNKDEVSATGLLHKDGVCV